jgi:hypothetical protein
MFRCERCGRGFRFLRAADEYCPRCWVRDGVGVPLFFAPFSGREVDEKIAAVRRVPLRPERNAREGLRNE